MTMNVNDPNEVAREIKEIREYGGKIPKAHVSVLDISEEWVGSWC